jgi:hypothetical protein
MMDRTKRPIKTSFLERERERENKGRDGRRAR